MSAPIQYVVEWHINPDGIEQFKELAAEATRLVQENELSMVGYHWYFSDDETRCTLLEWYPDADHIVAHRANLAEVLPRMLEVATIELRVFGGLDATAQTALAGRGVEYRRHFVGLDR